MSLVPLCLGLTRTFFRCGAVAAASEVFIVPVIAGMACWIVVLLLLPAPLWIYVAGHELTHALWTYPFGGRLRRIRVASSGGHAVVTRSNIMVVLAPYFFPLYTSLVAVLCAVLRAIEARPEAAMLFNLLLGFSYSFHITLSAAVLRVRQPDIVRYGWLLSGVVIWCMHMVTLVTLLALVTDDIRLRMVLEWCVQDIRHTIMIVILFMGRLH